MPRANQSATLRDSGGCAARPRRQLLTYRYLSDAIKSGTCNRNCDMHGNQVHLRTVRRHLDDPEKHQTAGQMPRAELWVSLLEPTGLQTQDKRDIKVRQGRNLRSQGVTGILCQIQIDESVATSVGGWSFRPACGRAPYASPGCRSCAGNCRTAPRRRV